LLLLLLGCVASDADAVVKANDRNDRLQGRLLLSGMGSQCNEHFGANQDISGRLPKKRRL
jgi:hypothetical protein